MRLSMCYDNISFSKEQLALLEDRDQVIGDLQFSLDERTAELEEVRGAGEEVLGAGEEVFGAGEEVLGAGERRH